jgi:hypothetical protein
VYPIVLCVSVGGPVCALVYPIVLCVSVCDPVCALVYPIVLCVSVCGPVCALVYPIVLCVSVCGPVCALVYPIVLCVSVCGPVYALVYPIVMGHYCQVSSSVQTSKSAVTCYYRPGYMQLRLVSNVSRAGNASDQHVTVGQCSFGLTAFSAVTKDRRFYARL